MTVADSTLAFDIVARGADSTAAQFAKVAAASDKAGSSMKKNSKISADAAKASLALTKAHNAESDALDKVQVAEARLADVRNNAKAKTAQVVAAEKGLAKARRDAAVAGDVALKAAKDLSAVLDNETKSAGKNAGKGFLGSLKSVGKEVPKVVKGWFTGNGSSVFKQLGQNTGGSFMASFMGVLKTPVIGPAVLVGVLAAIEAVATPAGAIVAAGLVAGAGAGLAAIGLKFAAESQVVKSIWAKTASDLANQMRTISKPFEATLVSMAAVARRTFATFRPELAAAFTNLAPALTAFGSQLGQAFGRLAPSIQPLAAAFKAVLGTLGPALNDVFMKLSASLTRLSDSVSKNPTALADMTRGIGTLVGDLISLVTHLNDADAAFKKLTGISSVTALMGTLRFAIGGVIGPIDLLAQGLTKLGNLANPVGSGFHYTATTAKEAATATGYWTQGMTLAQASSVALGGAVAKSAHETHAANVAATLAAGAYNRQMAATDGLIASLNRLSSVQQTLAGSQIAYQQAIDDATAALKSNGRTLDINTQKGRDNKTALLQVAASATAQRDAMLKANDGNVSAARFAEQARQSFVRQATQMGMSRAAAKAMAAQLIAIPNVTRTAKLQANKADLEAKLAAAKKQLADKDLTATKRAKLEAQIANLQAGIQAAKAALASVPASKTTTINVVTRYSSTGVNLTNPSSVGRRASGGPVKAGQPYLIGEKGPELMVPSTNGTVIPNNALKTGQSVASGMAQGMLGGGGSAVNAAGQVAAAMIAKANSVLGIASPSKAFAQIGLYINQGFRLGLLGSAKQVQSAMSSLMSKVLNISFNAADTKKALQNTIANLNNALTAARSRIKPVTGNSKQRASIERGNRQAEASIRSIQAKLKQARADLANVSSIAARLGTTVKRNAVIGMLNRENAAMQKLANARAVVANQLKAAQSKLAAAIQIRDDFKKQITDAAMSFNSIANIQPPDGGQLTAQGIIAQMSETLRKTQAFAANLARLKKSGLNSTTYQQIAEAGVEQGGSIADALLSGGGNTFNTINRLQSNINSAAAGLGSTAAANMYQAGVDAAQGLVNGLLAKTKALDAASKKLAAAIVAQIKKTLGIRSPSKVLEWHGSMAGKGFERGILGEYGNVRRAGAGLGDAAVPGARSRRSPVSANGGGTDTVTVPVQLVLDGKVIQQSLLKLKRTNGGLELGLA